MLIHYDPGYPPPPGTTTAGCAGLRKAEADSVAWITCARHGITPAGGLPFPASWAGTDPRAQPAAAILAAGHRITTAATRLTGHTVRILHGDDPAPSLTDHPAAQAARHSAGRHDAAIPQARTPVTQPAASPAPRPDPAVLRVLADAHAFYTSQLDGSWAPGYLHARGITQAAIRDWRIGYAPGGWTTLTSHLRRLGHHDDMIQAAGLADPLLPRHPHRPVPRPGHAPRPRRRRHARRVHRPRQPRAPARTYRNTSTAPRPPPIRRATCCSACTRPAPPSPGARSRSLPKGRSTPSPSPSPTPAGTPAWPPAAPP